MVVTYAAKAGRAERPGRTHLVRGSVKPSPEAGPH